MYLKLLTSLFALFVIFFNSTHALALSADEYSDYGTTPTTTSSSSTSLKKDSTDIKRSQINSYSAGAKIDYNTCTETQRIITPYNAANETGIMELAASDCPLNSQCGYASNPDIITCPTDYVLVGTALGGYIRSTQPAGAYNTLRTIVIKVRQKCCKLYGSPK